MAATSRVSIDPCAKVIFEHPDTDQTVTGTLFPYGSRCYPAPYLDGHRAAYTDDDARAVAEMVNGSSWLSRSGPGRG